MGCSGLPEPGSPRARRRRRASAAELKSYYTPCRMTEHTERNAADQSATAPLDVPEELAPRPPSRRRRLPVVGLFTVRHLAVVNGLIAIVLLLLFAITQPLGASDSRAPANLQASFYQLSSETRGLAIGQRAPDLVGADDHDQAIRTTDLDGHPLSIADLKGHPVWINFWATWCPPCQRETPDLRAAYAAHRKDGLVLVAIDVQEEPGVVRDYVTRYGLTYTIGLDVTGAVTRTYGVFGIPTHYFIDRDGVVRDRVFGPLDRSGMEQHLAKIIGP